MKKQNIIETDTDTITNGESESLDKFLLEISNLPLLSQEEEFFWAKLARVGSIYNSEIESIFKKLFKKLKQLKQFKKKIKVILKIKKLTAILRKFPKKGIKKYAIDNLVKANLRFVISVAKQYQNQGLSLSDLINEGNYGLIKGINRFDERKGFKCISYCVWWIRQSILQAISDKARCVRYPTNKLAFYNKVNKTYSKLEQKIKMPPSIKYISDYLNVSEKDVEEALSIKHTSLDAPALGEVDNSNLYDVIKISESPKTDHSLEKESLQQDIKILLETLSERESQIITLHYGLGCFSMNLEKIAYLLRLTRERCRQIEMHAIKRLKKSSRKKRLLSYLCKL
ncbi:MAG: sigma-70 family RNA polymerase sigma factor [Candidatus Karelsulcia muelleri]